jgi:hypothetical protein
MTFPVGTTLALDDAIGDFEVLMEGEVAARVKVVVVEVFTSEVGEVLGMYVKRSVALEKARTSFLVGQCLQVEVDVFLEDVGMLEGIFELNVEDD